MKVGGSVCTAKSENKFEVRTEIIERIVNDIKAARELKKFSLILVHGAGPFGHTNVVNYGINNGIHTEQHVKGFIKTHLDMAALNSHFLLAFEKAGVPAITIDPTACIIQKNKKIFVFDTRMIELLFAMNPNIVPIMHGDMVLDTKLKGSVISGDAIIPYLAKKLGAKKVLLGSDVAGIFTADPKKDANAKHIGLIDKKNFKKILKSVGESSSIDVTRGMKGKLENLKGLNAFIFDMNEIDSTRKALVSERVQGTKIKL
jgi:isopentenyl phosphate kinase